MINVFISHSHKDKMVARILARKLNQYGIYTWIDEAEIKIGDSLIEKIRDGLDKVDYIIALISADSVESEWVKKELDIAMNREIESKRVVVIPILTGKCEIPGFLKGKLYADMTSNKKINKNFPLLLSCFNVEYIETVKKSFTEFNFTVTEIIEKLENANEFEKIELLENITNKDRDLFKIDTFVNCINNLLVQENKNVDLISSVLEASSYCPPECFVKLNFKILLDNIDEVVIQTIEVAQTKKVQKLFDKKVFFLLRKDNINLKLKEAILEYFIYKDIDSKLAKKICTYVVEETKVEKNNKNVLLLKLLCKFIDEGDTDEIVDIICKNFYVIGEDARKKVINDVCNFGTKSYFLYISNPRIRKKFIEILTQVILDSDDEKVKSAVGLFLLVGDNNLISNRQDVWKLIDKLDDYSLEILLAELDSEYNISYIFQSDIDVEGFVRCMSKNTDIKNLAESIIAQIHLKSAIEAIEAYSIEPDFNADDILFTLLKETDINEHVNLLGKINEKINNSLFRSDLDSVLLGIAKYKINKSITHVINSFDFDIKELDMKLQSNIIRIKLIVEQLEYIECDLNGDSKIKVQSFIKKIKSLCVDMF